MNLTIKPVTKLALVLLAVSFSLVTRPVSGQAYSPHPGAVAKGFLVIPATDFIDEFPKGNKLTEAATLKTEWQFNNTAIVLQSETNLIARVTVPEEGSYYLYVRSKGAGAGAFKIAVNDRVTDSVFGKQPQLWKKGGSFKLSKGVAYVKITRITPGASFDVVVLSKKPDVTEEEIRPFQLNEEVRLLKQYNVPLSNAVKFGDVNGDGLTDFMVLTPDFSAYVFDNAGKELWNWKSPETNAKARSEFEAPGVVWDFDRDGKAEVVHWRFLDGKEWLVIASGETGQVKKQVEWPTRPLPHEYNNFRLAIAKLTSGSPNELVVYTDMGGTVNVNAYTSNLELLWEHTETRKKDNLGHYVYPADLNGDGIDEVLVGSLLLDAKGKEIWNRFGLLPDNHDHADSYKFADINLDGKPDIVTANSETGIFIYEAMTGRIIWQAVAEHAQQIQAGYFLKGVKGPQVVAGGRTYGNRQLNEPYLWSQLYWFDNQGNTLLKWPGQPINGNPDFIKGNWRGDGAEHLFWYKFKLGDNGKGTCYFPAPVFHMFDFMGKGAEEVITLANGILSVYGSKYATYHNKDTKKDLNYLKSSVVNHTHY
ncbi:hypothetical protein [Hufsiella ginkgonis]|uniref:Uncharacterized protein n=1 Tax=Hufsiella ginkgonis TaxID=2695274 RepID=A0A7K1XZW0_9SPHI|nr:hypothetical protein [Hufsiella ginkgonis]MXV16513.1 hypothetical protein [Hufsiella ginkgonis]